MKVAEPTGALAKIANRSCQADPFAQNFDANNRTVVNGASYDADGRQTAIGGYTNTFDAEGRLATSKLNNITTAYSYDGNGQRVMKTMPSATTTYVYDAAGQLAAEYSTAAGDAACAPCYLSTDQLGSTRMLTNASGAVVERHDYLPFGEEVASSLGGRTALWGGGGHVTEKFTGKERDSETTLDFFDVRYFSGAQGRFTSPDAPLLFADSENPQGWNLYVYGLNNPMLYSDPSGHDPCVKGVNPQTGATCITVTADAPKANYSDLLLYLTVVNNLTGMQYAQQFFQPALDWLGRPRDQGCMNRTMLAGGLAGFELGAAVGLASGGTLELGTVSLGFLGGAGHNGIAGLSSCMSGGGGGGGGGGAGGPLRGKAAQDAAAKLGYSKRIPPQKAPFDSHGQSVFSNGSRYITPDVDGHSGGVWKMFDSAGTRLGTFDANLNLIGK